MRFNVIGHITSEIGLGVMAADLIEALAAAGHDVIGFDVDPQLDRQNRSPRLRKYLRPMPQMYRDGVDVAVFPISAGAHWSREYRCGSRRIAVPLWELPDMNPGWLAYLKEFDGAIAPSAFIGEALAKYGYEAWPTAWPHPLTPVLSQGAREKWGLPDDAIVFVYSFDPSSCMQRKNPQAVVEAFRRAAMPNTRLVLQINRSADRPPMFEAWLAELRRAPIENVIIIDRHMSHAEAIGLIAACDVYVSLHRAEGLGLGMLEAMQVGKPVIATGWSGNMSFMDRDSAGLVEYQLRPVNGSIPAYTREAIGCETVWAEASVEHAAWWMRFLATNDEERAAIGEAARQKAADYQRAAHRLDWIQCIPETSHRKNEPKLYTPCETMRVILDRGPIRLRAGVPIALNDTEAARLRELGLLA